MATATIDPKKTDTKADGVSLADVLGVEQMALSDIRARLGPAGDIAIAKAWAAGEIEFGHRAYCITGPVGRMGSAIVIEPATEWSGAKTKLHKSFRDIIADELPKADKYKRYEMQKPEKFGEESYYKAVEISEQQAHADLALLVQLTDKGMDGVTADAN